MILFPVNPNLGDNQAVGAASAQFNTSMLAAGTYLFVADTSCYIQQGANPTASSADGSMLVPGNCPLMLQGRHGAKLAVIQSTTGGNASLTIIGGAV